MNAFFSFTSPLRNITSLLSDAMEMKGKKLIKFYK